MKKKIFLLIPAMMMALVACDNGGSNPSPTPNPTNKKEYISLTALKSIFDSYTVEGKYTYAQRSGFSSTGLNISLKTRYQTGGIELSVYAKTSSQVVNVNAQFVNSNGYVAQWYHAADNTIKLQYLTSSSGSGAATWSFDNDFDSVVSVKDFVKQADGTYSVVNADTRTAIAAAVAMGAIQIGAYDPSSVEIAKMSVTVENDKISGVTFESKEYVSNNNIVYKDLGDFTFTYQGATEVKCELTAYDTYAEANALKEAFDKIGRRTKAKITSNNTYKVSGGASQTQKVETNVYMNENLYYIENNNLKTNVTSRQGLAHSDTVGGTVIFKSDEDGNLTVTNAYENVKLSQTIYYPRMSQISPDMFEYKDGKYVTRNADDASNVGEYLLHDGSEAYVSQISIELDADKNMKVSYEYEAAIDNSSTTVISKNVMTFGDYDDSAISFLKLNDMEENLKIAKNIPSNMVNTWLNGSTSVSVSKYVVNIDGNILKISEVKDGVIKGTYVDSNKNTVNVSLSLIPATDKSIAMLSITIGENAPAKLLGANSTLTSTTFPLEYIRLFLTNNSSLELPTINASSFEYMIFSEEGHDPYFAVAIDGVEAGTQFVKDLIANKWSVNQSSNGTSYNCVDPSGKTTIIVMFGSATNGYYTLIAFFDKVSQ